MSSHLINEFRSLCVAVYDAAACRGRQNALEAEIPDIDHHNSPNQPVNQ